jgi:hypothetical protein
MKLDLALMLADEAKNRNAERWSLHEAALIVVAEELKRAKRAMTDAQLVGLGYPPVPRTQGQVVFPSDSQLLQGTI